MHRDDAVTRTVAGKETPVIPPSGETATPRSEKIVFRNYDHETPYEVSVTVTAASGEIIYDDRHYLLPLEYDSVRDGFPADECTVEVEYADQHEAVTGVRLDDRPDNSAVIEVGNGTLSLTTGL